MNIGKGVLAWWIFIIVVGAMMMGWCAGAMSFEGVAR